MSKLIFVGPLSYKEHPEKTGGAIVQFETILNELDVLDIKYSTLDTNKLNYKHKLSAFSSIIGQYVKLVCKGDVVVYFSSTNYKIFLPFFGLLKWIKPHSLLFRKIGGDFESDYTSSALHRLYIRFLLKKVDIIYAESFGLTQFLKAKGFNAEQFLNAREKPDQSFQEVEADKLNLVYIGRLTKSKGIENLIEIDDKLRNTVIDIYGPMESVSPEIFSNTKNIAYRGCFVNSEIYDVLRQYHAVLLPSEFRGEGHPGSIIEALMMGKPVITTKINYNKELVKEGFNGVLIENNSPDEIMRGITRLKGANYQEMSKNAKESVEAFDVTQNVKKLLKELKYED